MIEVKEKYYKCIHKNDDVVKKSSSGGIFTAISDYVLQLDGVVYGSVMNANIHDGAQHIRAENKEIRDRMRGSKYIPSDMTGIYENIHADLKSERTVLFTGTPCQIIALKKYLLIKGVQLDNLILLQVWCHGVGSNRFFRDYLRHLEKKYHGMAISCNFRRKNRAGEKQDMEVCFNNGRKYNASSTNYDWFYSAYLKNYILRPSCYNCNFSEKTGADISIADYWGGSTKDSYSIVTVHTEQGRRVFGCCENCLEYEELDKTKIKIPKAGIPERYKEFWSAYNSGGYLKVQKWLGNNTIKGKLRNSLLDIVYKLHIKDLFKYIGRRADGRK